MTDDTRQDAGAEMAAMTKTPGGLLGLAAMIFLAGYVIFEIVLNSWSFPTLGTIAAIFILLGRYRATGSAAVFKGDTAMFVLGMVIFLQALVYLIYDVRTLSLQTGHIEQLLGQLTHYVAGAIAGLGAYRMMR